MKMSDISLDKTIEKLTRCGDLPDEELLRLIVDPAARAPLALAADSVRRKVYGNAVYIRGLIEFTNHCKNNCYYCGIRAGNKKVRRYRLTESEILNCCDKGYRLGFRTFVLQGGEDPYFDDERLCALVAAIRRRHPDCAITLSVGEREKESYRRLKAAGADRYLLRHETATPEHYRLLHPASLSLEHRKNCLWHLKELGYQTGSGFMVGSPGQKPEHLVADLRFLQKLQPAMIGIGPFIHHPDTPFKDCPDGSAELTLKLISLLCLLFPYALLPATTALSTLAADGRARGLQAGANVVMPNLSPMEVRDLYRLYSGKSHSGAESAEGLRSLRALVKAAGYEIVTDRGDAKGPEEKING